MSDREKILAALMDVLGEEGCGVSCEQATIYMDDEGWKMMLEGFMETWKPGQTLEEAKISIRQYASMGFGLSESGLTADARRQTQIFSLPWPIWPR